MAKSPMPLAVGITSSKMVGGWLKAKKIKVQVCGSIRRECPIVNDVDMVISGKIEKAINIIVLRAAKADISFAMLSEGELKADFMLGDVQFNIFTALPEKWGAMVLFLTGSKEFNIKSRNVAKKKGYSLNQYGLNMAGETEPWASKSETDILRELGLEYAIDPTQR